MNSTELKLRSKAFAIEVIRLAEHLPNRRIGWTITDQIMRACTSVASNYRAVCRAKSDKDFISKMGTVIEEADETLFWLEMIDELGLLNEEAANALTDAGATIQKLLNEANQLVSIFVASNATVKARINK